MVLCAVDDLMFSVKISTTAKAIGAPIFFERNPEMIVARVREKQPSLVIFDLNSPKLRPLDAIAALKADPALRQIPTLGYASHVQTDVIQAAKTAGIDQVLARSAFTDRLAAILATPPSTPAGQSPQEYAP
jgi:CheY-like chemotaxis protein